jgi:hypothetical protein
MDTIQFEAQKANLAREILNSTDMALVARMWDFLKESNEVLLPAKKAKTKRELGFLKGKAKVVFHDDFKMTPEELGMI